MTIEENETLTRILWPYEEKILQLIDNECRSIATGEECGLERSDLEGAVMAITREIYAIAK